MKCNWRGCKEEASGNVEVGIASDRIEGTKGYCPEHIDAALAANNPNIIELVKQRLENKTVVPQKKVETEPTFWETVAQQREAEMYAKGSAETLARMKQVNKLGEKRVVPVARTVEDMEQYVPENRSELQGVPNPLEVSAFQAGAEWYQKMLGGSAFGGNEGSLGTMFAKAKHAVQNPASSASPWYKEKKVWGVAAGVLVLFGLVWAANGTIDARVSQGVNDILIQKGLINDSHYEQNVFNNYDFDGQWANSVGVYRAPPVNRYR